MGGEKLLNFTFSILKDKFLRRNKMFNKPNRLRNAAAADDDDDDDGDDENDDETFGLTLSLTHTRTHLGPLVALFQTASSHTSPYIIDVHNKNNCVCTSDSKRRDKVRQLKLQQSLISEVVSKGNSSRWRSGFAAPSRGTLLR